MKILYDSQIFDMQKFGGISRYFYKLAMYNKSFFDYSISGKYSENIYIHEISKIGMFPIKCYFHGKGRIINFSNRFSNKHTILSCKYDVFHPTYYFPLAFPNNKPIVITAHDFMHEIFPSFFPSNDRTTEAKRICFNKASRIIAISENTKKDLIKCFPEVDETKIDVVYHAIEWTICENKTSNPVNKPYILFTGTRNTYKNFTMFLFAVSPLLKKYDMKLVCTGGGFSKDETSLIHILSIEDRIINLFANEELLKALYENAVCFVFPSLYEGFGFPILEAFASKCPVAISNTSCFPEIAGDAAIYFNPYSQEDMTRKIEELILSKSKQQELVLKGIERFKKFSMDSMINNTYQVYKNACNQN